MIPAARPVRHLAVVRTAKPRESGQIMLLTAAFTALALILVLVVASASAVHLERKRLMALADAAALDAADSIDLDRFYAGGREMSSALARGGGTASAPGVGTALVPLSDALVVDAVRAHLRASPQAARFRGLRLAEPTGTPDGERVEVTLVAEAALLAPGVAGLPWGVPLRVTATAQATELP